MSPKTCFIPHSKDATSTVVHAKECCWHSDGLDDWRATSKKEIKVFDSLMDILHCLRKNRNENIIFFPKEKGSSEMNEAEVESLAVALSENTSLASLAMEEVHLSSAMGTPRFASALLKHPSIQKLTLYDNNLGDEGVFALLNAFVTPFGHPCTFYYGIQTYAKWYHPNNTLQTLCLCGNQIGDRGAYWIAQAMKMNRHLADLDLSSNVISSEGAMFLADMLPCCNLVTFILNGNNVETIGAFAIAAASQYSRSLEVLGLCGNNIGDDGAIHLSLMARSHPRLKAILVDDNCISERGFREIGEAHRQNPRLGMMAASWNACSPVAMGYIANSMQNMMYLYLDRCGIGDKQTEILANALRSNRTVRDLYLEGNSIGCFGARYVASALEVNNCLEGLFLSDGNEREGARCLCNVLRTCNATMKRLEIHDKYHNIQREMEVYLDMNGAGRGRFILPNFPPSLLSDFLLRNDMLSDPDLIYLCVKERPDLFQTSPPSTMETKK